MAPKDHMQNGLVTSLWNNWEVVETLGGGANGRKLGHWGHSLLGMFISLLLLPGHYKVSVSSATCFCHDVLPCHRSQSHRAK